MRMCCHWPILEAPGAVLIFWPYGIARQTTMASALDGLTVLDLTRGAAGALTTMTLSDHGARVIRIVDQDDVIDRRGGFLVWDRGKECMRLALKELTAARGFDADAGPAVTVFAALVAQADVVVEDFAPAERPALMAHGCLAALNPRLVSCSITAYGLAGPYKDEPPIDDLVLARSGILASVPGFRPAPIHVVHPLPSSGAAILAALGISAALLARQQTGRGRAVATSLLSGALLYQPKVSGENLEINSFQTNPYGSAPFYSVYACAGDDWLQLGCVHPGFIQRAASLMGITELLEDPVYGDGRAPQTPEADAHLRKVLTEVMAARSYADWAQAFEANDIPFARSGVTEDGLNDPQVRHNEMVVVLADPAVGPIEQMGVPIKLSAVPGAIQGPRGLSPASDDAMPPDLRRDVPVPAPTAPRGNKLDELPLNGVRILEITNLIAGPTAGRLLADLGADVMKLEPLAGDISRPIGRTYFYSVNFSKRSICVDTSQPEGKEIVAALAATCDVLLANVRPGATERMGIGPQVNDKLIETHVTGYGFTGPSSHRPGIDPLAQALIGLERAQGGQGNPPSFQAQLAPTDFTTGAMAALGTVLSLFARSRVEGAQRVEVNLLDGGILLSSQWFTRYAGRPERPLADSEQYGLNPFHRLYQVEDGFVYVVADTADHRTSFAAMLGQADPGPSDAIDPDGVHPNDTVAAAAFVAAFATFDLASATEQLSARGIPHAPAVSGASAVFFDDPHTHANDLAVTRSHPTAGRLTVTSHYVAFGNTAPAAARATPLLGQHTAEILGEAGFSREKIEQFYVDGLVKTEG